MKLETIVNGKPEMGYRHDNEDIRPEVEDKNRDWPDFLYYTEFDAMRIQSIAAKLGFKDNPYDNQAQSKKNGDP
jgi:hypothetical protein